MKNDKVRKKGIDVWIQWSLLTIPGESIQLRGGHIQINGTAPDKNITWTKRRTPFYVYKIQKVCISFKSLNAIQDWIIHLLKWRAIWTFIKHISWGICKFTIYNCHTQIFSFQNVVSYWILFNKWNYSSIPFRKEFTLQ